MLQRFSKPRPSVPPLLLAGVVFWVATALVSSACAELSLNALKVFSIASLCTTVLLGLIAFKQRTLLWILLSFAGLGVLVSLVWAGHYLTVSQQAVSSPSKNYTFQIAEDARIGQRGVSYTAHTRLTMVYG